MSVPSPPLYGATVVQDRRTRKSHAKVRTGCITCKIRRKKCDETKPHCRRCTSTGRKCDGYGARPPGTATPAPTEASKHTLVSKHVQNSSLKRFEDGRVVPKSPLSPVEVSLTAIRQPPSTISFGSEIDYHCFDFFRLHTAPRFASYFDSSIWRGTVMKLAFASPMVLKAATAVGAVHRRFNHGISREAFEYCAIADRLQKSAVISFIKFAQEETTNSNFREIIMLASMLFGLFEVFQGNDDRAVQYMTFGLNSLWSRPLLVVHSESRYLNYEIGPTFFHRLFEKLGDRATQLLGYRPRIVTPYESGHSLPPLPSCFASVKEAVDTIFTQADWIMQTPVRIWYSKSERRRSQRMHVSYILMWSAAYAEMAQHQSQLSTIETQACMVVKHTRDILYTLIYIIFCVRTRNNSDNQDLILNELAMDMDMDVEMGADVETVRHIHDTPMLIPANNSSTPANSDQLLQQPLLHHPHLWHHINSHPSMVTKLTRLALLVETRCTPTSIYTYTSDHSFSLDSGIGPPLTPDPCLESSSKTRHLVTSLMTKTKATTSKSGAHPRQHIQGDGDMDERQTNTTTDEDENDDDDDDDDDNQIWSAIGVYSVAERVSSIEEHAVLRAITGLGLTPTDTTNPDANVNISRGRGQDVRAGTLRGVQPTGNDGNASENTQLATPQRPDWVDVTAFLEEGKLLVRYCQDDGLGSRGKGLVWVQEWLEF